MSCPPCTIDGCTRVAADQPHLHQGEPVCPKHAVQLGGGRCAWCGEEFAEEFGGCDAFPSAAGKAYCIECWESEAYGYSMRPKAGP